MNNIGASVPSWISQFPCLPRNSLAARHNAVIGFVKRDDRSLAVAAQNQIPSRDRQGADANALISPCIYVQTDTIGADLMLLENEFGRLSATRAGASRIYLHTVKSGTAVPDFEAH